MAIVDQINNDLKAAMKAKDAAKLRALRAVRSAVLLAQTEKGGQKDLADADVLKILQKQVKQRQDSIKVYQEQGREDLAKEEQDEVAVIEAYLPKPLSQGEIEEQVEAIIKNLGATGMQDMGKVMGQANKTMAGRADGATIAQIVKAKLGA